MSEPDQDRGIGTFLLSALKQLCRKIGVTTITGHLSQKDIDHHGDRLFHFYKKNGFQVKANENGSGLEIECKMNQNN
jgi:GNAT superfamily N-acetyltransferase